MWQLLPSYGMLTHKSRMHWCNGCGNGGDYTWFVPAQMSGWQGAQALHAEGGSAVAYTGMMDCLVRTVKEEGVRALFKVPYTDSFSAHGSMLCRAPCNASIFWPCNCIVSGFCSVGEGKGQGKDKGFRLVIH